MENAGKSIIGEIASGGVGSITRNNAGYTPGTGARITFLDPTRDLAYRQANDSALTARIVALKYGGSVQVIDEADRSRQTLQYGNPVEPYDYYLRHADGSLERCDREGNLNPALEFATGVAGAVALPDGSGSVATPGTPGTAPAPTAGTTAGTVAGTVPWRHYKSRDENASVTLAPHQTHTWTIPVPADAPAGDGHINVGNMAGLPLTLVVTGGSKEFDSGTGDSYPLTQFAIGTPLTSGAGEMPRSGVIVVAVTNDGEMSAIVDIEVSPPGLG